MCKYFVNNITNIYIIISITYILAIRESPWNLKWVFNRYRSSMYGFFKSYLYFEPHDST